MWKFRHLTQKLQTWEHLNLCMKKILLAFSLMFDFFSRFQRESGMYISTYMSLTKDFLRLNLLSLTDFPLPSKNMIY